MVVHKTHRPHLAQAEDARAVRTRQALRQAMLKLLENQQFETVTIGDVAAAAEVGYSTVCRHYPTLDALLDDVAAEEIRRIIDLSFPSFDLTDPRKSSVALFTQINAHRAVWSTLLKGGAAGAFRREFLRITQAIADAWSQPEPWLPRDLGATMTVSGTIELLTWWLKQEEPMPVAKIAAIFQRLLVAPLMPELPAAVKKRSAAKKKAR